MDPELSLIVPTYNGADNIAALVRRVDDDSPDGTAEVGRALQAEYPVEVIVCQSPGGQAPVGWVQERSTGLLLEAGRFAV